MESAGSKGLGLSAGWWRAAAVLIAVVFVCGAVSGAVIPKKDKLTDDEKIEILRNLSSEYAKAKTYLPRSKSPLEYDVNGTWDMREWQSLSGKNGGVAAREGDQIKITHVSFEGDKLELEINGGLKSGRRWFDHLEAGVGNSTQPVSSGNSGVATTGTNIAINFHKPLENLTAAEVKRILAPLMTFDLRSVSANYLESLPPEMQKAIADKRALEGMDREQVKLALGSPIRKYREAKDGVDLEDWIFGQAPGKITFVTFQGAKVVKVKEQYAGLGSETAPNRVIVP